VRGLLASANVAGLLRDSSLALMTDIPITVNSINGVRTVLAEIGMPGHRGRLDPCLICSIVST